MIDMKMNGNQLVRCQCSGDHQTLAAELGLAVQLMYSLVSKRDPEAARSLKWHIQAVMADESPVWQVDESVAGICLAREVKRDG